MNIYKGSLQRVKQGWGKRAAVTALAAGILMLANFSANAATTLLGNPYTPQGADFSIYAIQGIDTTTGTGSGGSPQVNLGFEFDDGIGVSYTNSNGSLTHFGLGLYAGQNSTASTALRIQYNGLVSPNGINVRLEDFDLHANATFFNPNKVEPGMLLLGANNTVLANALPTDVWAAMRNVGGDDVWDVNLGQLAARLNINAPISGFILYADKLAGERANSDPYFLVSSGMPAIPEPSTYFAGFAAVVFALVFHAQKVRQKKVASRR